MASLPVVRTDTVSKIDNATLIELFSAWAGVLQKREIMTLKDTNALRISLNDIQCFDKGDDQPILLKLQQNNSEFIHLLISRFGELAMCQNIARYTLRNSMRTTALELSLLAKYIIPRIPLLFNRPIHEYIGDHCERLTLFSTVLLDFMEHIERSVSEIEGTADELSALISTCEPENEVVEKDLALAVGFSKCEPQSIFLSRDSIAKKKYAVSVTQFLMATCELLKLLKKNGGAAKNYSSILLLIENLELQIESISKLNFPKTHDAELWEHKRFSISVCTHSINEGLRQLCSHIVKMIDSQASRAQSTPFEISSEIKRKVTIKLVKSGLDQKAATEATESLVTYCYQRKITPSSLILGELKKLNPAYTEEIFELLRMFEQDFSLQNRQSHEKHNNVERVNRLTKVFSL